MNRPRATDALQPWEIDAVIDWFMYRIDQEDRGRLMRDLPHTYNRLVGRDVCEVSIPSVYNESRCVLKAREDE